MTVTEQDRERAQGAISRYTEIPWDLFEDPEWAAVDVIAQALADERDRAIEPFTILADEMERQVEFRREGDPESLVADVRETDLRWLRLAISNARDPR